MAFIRPEARAALYRYREALAGLAVLALGLFWLSGFGLIRWIGVVMAVAGLSIAFAGLQRARFRGGHGGVGLVEIRERELTYFAPIGGGSISLDRLVAIDIAPDSSGYPLWRLRSADMLLSVPARAEGTDALFEALAALPGIDLGLAARASTGRPEARVVIWRRD